MLNLWSWRDVAEKPHVGVSEGPNLDRVLDLQVVDSALDSISALWECEPRVQELEHRLSSWHKSEVGRVPDLLKVGRAGLPAPCP